MGMSIHHEVISLQIYEFLQVCCSAVHSIPVSMGYKCPLVSDVELIIYREFRIVVAVSPHHVDLAVEEILYELLIALNITEMYQHVHISNYIVYLLYAAAFAMGITYYQNFHLCPPV